MRKYNSLKEYIQDNFYDLLLEHVTNYALNKKSKYGYPVMGLASICDEKIENLTVSSIHSKSISGSHVHVMLGVSADIVTLGLGKKEYTADKNKRWFSIHFDVNLREKFDIDEKSIVTTDYKTEEYDRKCSLSEFMLPYMYGDDLEEMAADFTLFYCQDAIYSGYQFPMEYALRNMELTALEADLPNDTMGRMYFRNSKATVYRMFPLPGGKIKKYVDENATIESGTILINKSCYFMGDVGSETLTLAHELVHWEYHQNFFKILSLLDEDSESLSCEANPIRLTDDMGSLDRAKWFAEWQANALAIRIAMPEPYFDKAMQEAYSASSGIALTPAYEADKLQDTIRRVGALFGVSPYIAKQRAIQLGYDVASGTYVYVDGEYYMPFNFKQFTLGKNQTFTISWEALHDLCGQNKKVKSLIDSGKFVYTGHLVCINSEKYVCKIDKSDTRYQGHDYVLTEYARGHVDECCLVFNWKSIFEFTDSGDFYGQCYLSKNVCAAGRVEYSYDPDFENNQSVEAMLLEIQKLKDEFEKEDQVMRELPNSFSETLKYHMRRRKVTILELSLRTGLSDKIIKQYRSGDSVPTLSSLMAIFKGLCLKEMYCDHMMKILGYSLNEMNEQQKVYRILIRDYMDGDLEQWNQILEGFGLDQIPKKNH